jgi:hypothetical protein
MPRMAFSAYRDNLGRKEPVIITQITPLRIAEEQDLGEYEDETEYPRDPYAYHQTRPAEQDGWRQYSLSGESLAPEVTPNVQEYTYQQGYEQVPGQGQVRSPLSPWPHENKPTNARYGRPSPNYKPLTLRWPFILALIVVLLGLMASVVFACRMLPVAENPGPLPAPAGQGFTTVTVSKRRYPTIRPRVPVSSAFGQNGTVIITSGSGGGTPTLPTTPSSSSLVGGNPGASISDRLPLSSQFASNDVSLSSPATSGPPTSASSIGGPVTSAGGPATVTSGPSSDGDAAVSSAPLVILGQATATTLSNVIATVVQASTGVDGSVRSFTQLTTLHGVITSVIPGLAFVPASLQTLMNSMGSPTATVLATPSGAVGSPITTVLTDFNGRPTATLTEFRAINPITTTLTDANGRPTATLTEMPAVGPAETTVLTNSAGVPTATLTEYPVIGVPIVTTLQDSNGVPTATLTEFPGLSTLLKTTLTNSDGVPTATFTEYPLIRTATASSSHTPTASSSAPTEVHIKYLLGNIDYFIGSFLPVIVGTLLTIPIRMIDLSAKQFQPFHEMTRPAGASMTESLGLRTTGVYGVIASIRSLISGRALIFLTNLMVVCSALVTSIASEAVSLKLHGTCTIYDFRGCYSVLSVFLVPAYVTLGLLALMVALMLLALAILRSWRSGVSSNPWSIAGIASLTTNTQTRALIASARTDDGEEPDDKKLRAALNGHTFKLGSFVSDSGILDYGILTFGPGTLRRFDSTSRYSQDALTSGDSSSKGEHHMPFLMLSYWLRLLFLALLSALLALILYYQATPGATSGFELFMDSQGFAVRFVFTFLGICITFFWSSLFTSKLPDGGLRQSFQPTMISPALPLLFSLTPSSAALAIISPYQAMSTGYKFASDSILLTAPIHALTGLGDAIRSRNYYLVTVGFTAILSETMPVLLGNVPFHVMQTYATQSACAYSSIGILVIMWLVVFSSFFKRWRHMPVDPTTVAGSMYYICDSAMLTYFEGTSRLNASKRRERINDMGLRYYFGGMLGVSGMKRTGVEATT